MKEFKIERMALALAAAIVLAAVCALPCAARGDDARERIFQVALLHSLVQGNFDGSISARELKRHGDIGIGTFDRLDGEMIMLDGKIWRAAGDGTVSEAGDGATIPFSNVTFFRDDVRVSLKDVHDIDALFRDLTRIAEARGRNNLYMARIDGKFRSILVRSERAQTEPVALVEALANDQTEFAYSDISGTLVALYCPSYMAGLNSAGWHLHFISADCTKGGHVLAVDVELAEAAFDITPGFELYIPADERFQNMDLGRDMSRDIESAERDKR